MDIKLKNIRYSKSLSQETHAYIANIYINDKHVATAHNNGCGGKTSIYLIDLNSKSLLKEAKEYCISLPAEIIQYDNETFSFDMDLETYIDNLLVEYLNNKYK
jgi:hypothetical protein